MLRCSNFGLAVIQTMSLQAGSVVLVVQGGLLPVALEMWRNCPEAIAGVIFSSPPPLRFFTSGAPEEVGVRRRFRDSQRTMPSRRQQRALWLLSQSTLGGLFFRYLRGANGKRIRAFSERNLFHRPENVDDEWMEMCHAGSRDTRSRHATFAYLVGTVPGGSWRDDRSGLLASLDVPCQVLRGDTVEGAAERLRAFLASVPRASCSALVPDGRAVLPYENAADVCDLIATFMAKEFDGEIEALVRARRGGALPNLVASPATPPQPGS